ncbi:hypothetical protein ALC56_13779, partial [Trachymyrmex septentrionalis]
NELAKSSFLEIFSNVTIALRILLIVPMSVTTVETLFKIKKKEVFERYTMTLTRSCDLTTILIEKELANSLGYVIVSDNVTKKKRNQNIF